MTMLEKLSEKGIKVNYYLKTPIFCFNIIAFIAFITAFGTAPFTEPVVLNSATTVFLGIFFWFLGVLLGFKMMILRIEEIDKEEEDV